MSVVRRAHADPSFPASYDVTKAIPAFVERHTVIRFLMALCATASALTSCFARDTPKWIQIGSTVSALQARSNAPMAFDSARGKAILFGGSDGTNVLSDTCEWDTGAWRKAASTGPSARESACMAYDSIRGRTVLFGGSDGTNAFSDTWEWDGSCWTKVSTTGPSARSGSSMAYDSVRGRTVLFGGKSTSGSLSDTWEWDGNVWKQVATTGPFARQATSMVYDASQKQVVLFGGADSGDNPLSDTWEWDGSAWKQIAAVGPPARSNASMTYDSVRKTVVLLGGWGFSDRLSDTWEWDGSAWKHIIAAGPSTRSDASMTFDTVLCTTIVFGGYSGSGVLSDTWKWDGTTWKQVPTWPSARSYAGMAYDSARGRTVLFGGTDNLYSGMSDTWEWDGSAWRQVAISGPPARHGPSMAYDSARGKTVLFGGYSSGTGSSPRYSDTWEWDGKTWSQVSTTGPGARNMASIAYESARGKTLLFGGCSDSGYYGDTWEWDGSIWTQVSTTGPSSRTCAPMVYDSARGRAVLYGGFHYGVSVSTCGDTWEWDGNTWTRAATTGPSARMAASMAYDSIRDTTVLYGGSYDDSTSQRFGDTWQWDMGIWTQVSSIGPSPRSAASMAYDSTRARTVLFGGYSPSCCLSDLWEYGVVHTFTLADAATALRLAGGLTSAASSTISMLNVATTESSAGTVDIADAVLIARKAAGLDLNP